MDCEETMDAETAGDNRGKVAVVDYRGWLANGTEFDSTFDRNTPMVFRCGVGMMVPGFDATVADMQVGETRKVHVPAADAFGEYREDLVKQVPLERIPDGEELPVGTSLVLNDANGMPIQARVTAIADGVATFDLNNELAGEDLDYEITLLELRNN